MASICIFEDESYKELLPVCWMRPVFDLRCGITTLLEKVRREYPRLNTYVLCRDYLVDTVKGKYPGTIINKLGKENTMLFINGRVIFDSELAKAISVAGQDEVFESDGTIVAVRLAEESLETFRAEINGMISAELLKKVREKSRVTTVKARIIGHYFDLINENGREIEREFNIRTKGGLIKGKLHQTAILNPKGRIFIDDGSSIEAYAVLDAKDGPIYIGRGVTVNSHVRIEGPAFIGDRSVITGGRIRKNTSIGHYSKVGGEIEGSIFQGYGNKQHDGFIGHCYIGEWVNLGAGTTNSDLKNNYGNIKVQYMDSEVDSKQVFLGAAIADHTKTGIGTLINSGSVVGIACNLFGGGLVSKFIPSFAWGGDGEFKVHELDKAIKTAEAVMKRRGVEMSEADTILFRKIFDLTEDERTYLKRV